MRQWRNRVPLPFSRPPIKPYHTTYTHARTTKDGDDLKTHRPNLWGVRALGVLYDGIFSIVIVTLTFLGVCTSMCATSLYTPQLPLSSPSHTLAMPMIDKISMVVFVATARQLNGP